MGRYMGIEVARSEVLRFAEEMEEDGSSALDMLSIVSMQC